MLTSRRRNSGQGGGGLSARDDDEVDGPVAGGDVLDPHDLPPGCPKVEVATGDRKQRLKHTSASLMFGGGSGGSGGVKRRLKLAFLTHT